MNHLKALLMKFIMITAVLFIVLSLVYGVSFGDVLAISTLLTVTAYVIGDMFILPRFGNAVATMSDFGIAFLGTWMFVNAFSERIIPVGLASFYAAVGITLGEWFYHKYVDREVLSNQEPTPSRKESYATEFAEEPDVSNNPEDLPNNEKE